MNGDDLLPDVAVGRPPASNADKARALAEKVVAFERGGYGFADGPVVLVVDDPDRGGTSRPTWRRSPAGSRDATRNIVVAGRSCTRSARFLLSDDDAFFNTGVVRVRAAQLLRSPRSTPS